MLKFPDLKKTFLIMASLILLIAAGCSNSEESGKETKSGKTKLTIWLWTGMGIEEQIKEYAKENNIEVDIQLAEQADVHNNLTTSLAAGSGAPDISAVEIKAIIKFLEHPDHFYNLYDFGAGDIQGDYLDWKFKQAMTADEETLIGLPTDIGPQAMAYRTDIFEEAGLPTDREEVAKLIQTWDDYIEIGKQIKESTGKAMIDSANGLFSVIEGQGDKKYYDKEGNIIVADNPQLDKAYKYATKVIDLGLEAGFEQWSTEWGTGMTNGDFATLLSPAWMMGFMKSNAPDAAGKWDITSLPEGSGNWGGSFLTIPKQSENAEEAYKLIEWLLSPEQQLVTFKETGPFPSTPAIYEDEAIQGFTSDYFGGAPVGKIYSEAAKQVKPVIEGADSETISGLLGDAIGRVRDSDADPEESWKEALEAIERQLNR